VTCEKAIREAKSFLGMNRENLDADGNLLEIERNRSSAGGCEPPPYWH
jgi:hypothetical protein